MNLDKFLQSSFTRVGLHSETEEYGVQVFSRIECNGRERDRKQGNSPSH